MAKIGDLRSFQTGLEVVLTFGVFDGVHRGHQHLIGEVMAQAQRMGILSGVVVFSPHPRSVLSPGSPVPHLMTREQRVRFIAAMGVDLVVTMEFTRELSLLSPEAFLDLVGQHLSIRALVVGPDFALGHKRAGTPAVLAGIGAQRGFHVIVVPEVDMDSEKISSTRIREIVMAGDIERATYALGHYPTVAGVAGPRASGDPGETISLVWRDPVVLPPMGLYAAYAEIGGRVFPAILSVTTSGGTTPTVHVALLEGGPSVQGSEVIAHVVARLPGGQREALPIVQARTVLSGARPPQV